MLLFLFWKQNKHIQSAKRSVGRHMRAHFFFHSSSLLSFLLSLLFIIFFVALFLSLAQYISTILLTTLFFTLRRILPALFCQIFVTPRLAAIQSQRQPFYFVCSLLDEVRQNISRQSFYFAAEGTRWDNVFFFKIKLEVSWLEVNRICLEEERKTDEANTRSNRDLWVNFPLSSAATGKQRREGWNESNNKKCDIYLRRKNFG